MAGSNRRIRTNSDTCCCYGLTIISFIIVLAGLIVVSVYVGENRSKITNMEEAPVAVVENAATESTLEFSATNGAIITRNGNVVVLNLTNITTTNSFNHRDTILAEFLADDPPSTILDSQVSSQSMRTILRVHEGGGLNVAVGIGAGIRNLGVNTFFTGNNAGLDNTGNSVHGFGVNALRTASSQGTTAFGVNAGRDSSAVDAFFVTQRAGRGASGAMLCGVGLSALQNNIGSEVTGLGGLAAQNNAGSFVVGIGRQASRFNTGTDVVSLGQNAAQSNTGSDVIALGRNAGQSNTQSNRVIISQESLPQFAGAAAAALALPAPGLNGIFLYWDTTDDTIKVRP